MSKHTEKIIEVAPREMRRIVNNAVGKSFLKSITQPITNSDSAVKNMAGVSHSSGLVDLILGLKQGDRVDTAALKTKIPHAKRGAIELEITTKKDARLCRVVDSGPGMSANELTLKFGVYAKAKAAGQKTRSLFGRGALDVLLYHDDSVIYSVKDGKLSACKVSFTDNARIRIEDLGNVSKSLLEKYGLPRSILKSGTVVQFKLNPKTSIPNEDQIIDKISKFYMLRLIAADPNIDLKVTRYRAAGKYESSVVYDFPVGTVLAQTRDRVDFGSDGQYPLEIFVARSDEPLYHDATRIEVRENGLLFVDENDAVLDLTLLPEHDKNPFLQHIYGIVRIPGIRTLLESKLEAVDAADVLTVERDGFNRKHEITQKLFSAVEKIVKPIYQNEEKRQKKGAGNRSDVLTSRIKDALKALNDFNKKETDDGGGGQKDPEGPISFSVSTIQLYSGISRSVSVFVSSEHVKKGEIVLFESDNPNIKVDPDSEIVDCRKGQRFQKIRINLTCDVTGNGGTISALTLDKNGNETKAELKVLGVTDPIVPVPPDNIEFSSTHYVAQPNKSNTATLLVNINAFAGMPEVTFWLEDVVGNITLGGANLKRIQIKVTTEVLSHDGIARVPIPYNGTGWGQRATIRAKAKIKDGSAVHAKCKVAFERPKGQDKFSDFEYEDLRSTRLGDVASDRIYVNAGYGPHKQIFGSTPDDFNKQLEISPAAQLRAAAVLVEAVVYDTAFRNFHSGGKKGIEIDPNDPMTSLRTYLDEKRIELEPAVLKALAPEVGTNGKNE